MCVEESATSRKERLHCRDATKCKASCTNGQGIGTSCNADFNSTDHNHTPCLNKELILETKKARKILSWVVDSIIGAEAVATCHLESDMKCTQSIVLSKVDVFQWYTAYCDYKPALLEFYQYFEKYYVGGFEVLKKKPSRPPRVRTHIRSRCTNSVLLQIRLFICLNEYTFYR